jgi:phosphodiesterase/alkaline phosphatase D-like protein
MEIQIVKSVSTVVTGIMVVQHHCYLQELNPYQSCFYLILSAYSKKPVGGKRHRRKAFTIR